MVCDTPPSQDASTHQIWNSYLKDYRRYGPDTKAGRTDGHTDGHTDGLTDGRTVRLLYASQSSFGGIKIILIRKIGFQNTLYTKCINVLIDSIGPSIILSSSREKSQKVC